MALLRDSEKVDYITVANNVFTHKQIEYWHNIVFMRMKKRKFRRLF